MLNDLVRNELVNKQGVFYLKDHKSFNYNDGDEVEQYIYSVISNAKDISSGSRELELSIKDWPSLYHLSRERSLAYSSLALPSDASVLEVGCGCGAVTRFLGEKVAHVLALEGSPRRAAITRARTRDLDTVSVLCASFEKVVFSGTYDVIVCNGVLEYAPLFVDHGDPAREFLRLLTSLLKPGGCLIVAIENKLGLRYFSSGREEHTNIMFDGLEGYARFSGGPITFGFSELHGMLREHCAFVETLLPLPDYKLPSAIVRAELLDLVNCADLFATVSRHDFGSYRDPGVHERLVWHELHKNHLMKDFANSYFMIAGQRETTLLKEGWLGDIYAIKRNAGLMVRTTIFQQDGAVRTNKQYLESAGHSGMHPGFNHDLPASRWVDGVSIHTMMARAMLKSGAALSLEQRLRDPVTLWWQGLAAYRQDDGALLGEALDCIWQNAILEQGRVCFIDKEWVCGEKIDPLLVIYRSVVNFAAHEKYYLQRWDRSCRKLSEMKLVLAVARLLGVPATLGSVFAAMKSDLDLLLGAHGKQSAQLKRFLRLFVPFDILKKKEESLRRFAKVGARLRRLPARVLGRLRRTLLPKSAIG